VCCTAPHSTAHVGLARGLLKEREPGLSHVRVRDIPQRTNAVDLPTSPFGDCIILPGYRVQSDMQSDWESDWPVQQDVQDFELQQF
jgi:hypothetical protein